MCENDLLRLASISLVAPLKKILLIKANEEISVMWALISFAISAAMCLIVVKIMKYKP